MKRKVDWEEEEQSERVTLMKRVMRRNPESKIFWTISPKPFKESVLQSLLAQNGHFQRYFLLDTSWAMNYSDISA